MSPWMIDLAKEVVVMVLTAGLSWVGHFVSGLAKDVNAFFQKVRCLEERVSRLENKGE